MPDVTQLTIAGVEYRQGTGAGVVSGAVVRYGDVAHTRRGREVVFPGAFLGLGDAGLPVNIQHRQQATQRITNGVGLTFRDTDTALYADLALPDNAIGHAAADGVRDGSLTGWSSEFLPLIETPENGGISVYRALMVGLSVVDVPAYKSSLVVLNRGGGGRLYYDRPIVTRDRGRRRKESYRPKAFERGLAAGRDVVLYLRETGRGAVASRNAGSLLLLDTDEYLEFSVEDFPNTEAAADFIALAESDALDFGVRPLIQVPDYPDAFTDVPEVGNEDVLIRHFSDVILNGILITNSAGVNPDVGDVMLNARRLAWL